MSRFAKTFSFLSLIWGDLKTISGVLGIVAIIITLPTLTASALAAKFLDDAMTVGEAIVLTWPLTISATILFMMIMRDWFRGQDGFDIAMALAVLVIAPYLVALLFGATDPVQRRLTSPDASWLMYLHPAHAAMLAADILLSYLSLHGLWRTVSSLVCGLVLAWTYEGVLLPRARQIRDDLAGPQ
jgi:hypothetical protein